MEQLHQSSWQYTDLSPIIIHIQKKPEMAENGNLALSDILHLNSTLNSSRKFVSVNNRL